MELSYHNPHFNNQCFPTPNNSNFGQFCQNFGPRGPPTRFRPPVPHWRQPQGGQDYSNEFWCETCDRGFRTLDILEKHKQQHQKCNIDGCQFIAHPKVITKHIQMQHSSGLYKKIAKLQDPEEIRKWREERKKKYPTKENVEKAAAAIKEKIERGEKMGLRNNRHEKNLHADSSQKRKPFNKHNMGPAQAPDSAPYSKKRRIAPKNIIKKLPVPEDTRSLKPFAGIQELMLDADTEESQDESTECGFNIEDEDELQTNTTPEVGTGSVCHALSSLICNYGSSDEDEINDTPVSNHNTFSVAKKNSEKEPAIISIIKTEIKETQMDISKEQTNAKPMDISKKQVIVPTRNESDDDSGPEEVKVTKEVPNDLEHKGIKPAMRINKRRPKENIPQKRFSRPKPKLPSTLLQKLLFKEMKHERNIVLQCIRHIIKNDFFDKSV